MRQPHRFLVALTIIVLTFSAVAPAGVLAVETTTDPGSPPADETGVVSSEALFPPEASVFLATSANETTASGSDGNETESSPDGNETETDSDESPGMADGIRVTPISVEEDWIGVETAESDEQFNTTGPFAVFGTSEPVEIARIEQSGADARVLDGDQAIEVDYDDDAAPSLDGTTYFELELHFADGSVHTVDLYASNTGVSAAASEYEEYGDLVDQLISDAQDEGYDATSEDVEAYYDGVLEDLELLEMLFVERAANLLATGIMFISNPLGVALFLIVLAAGMLWIERKHGWMVRIIADDAGAHERKLTQLKLWYQQNTQAAWEEELYNLDGVSRQQQRYLEDAFGVSTVGHLADIARRGPPSQRGRFDQLVDSDADQTAVTDGGTPADEEAPESESDSKLDEDDVQEFSSALAAVDPTDPHNSWLAEACTPNRLGDPTAVLVVMKKALYRMEHRYNMAQPYRSVRMDCSRLIDEINDHRGVRSR